MTRSGGNQSLVISYKLTSVDADRLNSSVFQQIPTYDAWAYTANKRRKCIYARHMPPLLNFNMQIFMGRKSEIVK